MEWRGRKQSGNIEDWCQMSGRSGGSVRAGEVGGVGIIAYFLGLDVTPFLNGGALDTGPSGPAAEMATDDIAAVELVSVVLADTEAVWTTLFKSQAGMGYDPVTLVLFKGVTTSACGSASGATGRFIAPVTKRSISPLTFSPRWSSNSVRVAILPWPCGGT
jgi:predicted metalloprotease